MYLFKIASIAIASILFLSACNLPDTQKRSEGSDVQASFFADEVSGSLLNETFQEHISLPKERIYLMKVCLRDLKHSKAILNHPFQLEDLNQEVKTDASGCLNWNEKVSFEYLADPVFIKYDRKIKSTGIHTGTYTVSFAINPWDTENYHNAIDLSKNKVEPLLDNDAAKAKLAGMSDKQVYDLWVEDGRMFVSDDRMGDKNNNNENYELKYEFNINPYIKTKKTSGEASQYNLKFGLFTSRIEVIQRTFIGGTSEKNLYEMLAIENVKDAKMEKGTLSFSRTLKFKNGPPAKGSLFVRLYLKPSKNVPNLKPFVGVFPIGDFRTFRSNQFLKVLPSGDFMKELEDQLPLDKTYESKATLGQAASSTEEIKAPFSQTSRADSTITWTNIEPTSPVGGILLTNNRKRLTYPVHICFTNNLTNLPLAYQNFTVRGFSTDEKQPGVIKENVVSRVNGCIYWTDTVEFDIYECRHYKRGYLVIENPDYNIKIKKYYYINPWDEYFGGIDEAALNDKTVMNTSCTTDKPRRTEIVLDSVAFNTHRIIDNNDITNLLDFKVTKEFGITINPKVKITSDIKKDYEYDLNSLLDGPYLLRVMITRNIKLNGNYEIIAQKDIPVLNRLGTIYAKFPFSVKDQKLLLTRNTIFVQLLPILNEKVVSSEDDVTVKLKDPNEPLENIVDKKTSLITPVFTQELVLDGESHKSLRAFKGSEYTNHLKIEFKDEKSAFDFSALVAEYRAKLPKPTDEASKRVPPVTYAASEKLDFFADPSSGKLPISNWFKSTLDGHKIEMDRKTAEELCTYWFQHYWKGKLGPIVGEWLLGRACSSAANGNIKAFFDFDQIFFIKKVLSSNYSGAGAEKSISLGTTFSVSKSLTESNTQSNGVGSKVGLGTDLFRYISAGVEGYLVFDKSESSANSDSNTTSLSEGANLSVTESRFKVYTDDFQYCLSIKPSAKIFQNSSKGWFLMLWDKEFDYSKMFRDELKAEEKLDLTQKGLMVCRSAPRTDRFMFNEQYYWVTMPLSANEIQDPFDERNKQFTIMIRGYQNYRRFKFQLTQRWQRPQNATITGDTETYLDKLIEMQSWQSSPPGVHVYRAQ